MPVILPENNEDHITYRELLENMQKPSTGDAAAIDMMRIIYHLSVLNNNLYYLATNIAKLNQDTENSELPKIDKF